MNNYNLVKALEIKELNEKFLQDVSRFAALCQAAKRWHCAVGQLAQNRCYTLARIINN